MLPVIGTVCPNISCPHPLCRFPEVASRLMSSSVPSHDFYRNIFVVSAQWQLSFRTLKSFVLLTHTVHVGVSGNVLINKNVDRLNSYNVWNYAEGQDSFSISMFVDLTQPPDKVSSKVWANAFVILSNAFWMFGSTKERVQNAFVSLYWRMWNISITLTLGQARKWTGKKIWCCPNSVARWCQRLLLLQS